MTSKYPFAFEISNDDQNENRAAPKEAAEIILGSFCGVTKLEFDSIPVGSEAEKIMNLRNPSDAVLRLSVIAPKDFPARGFTLNKDQFEIPPHSNGELRILFKPLKELQCRDTIHLLDKSRNQKFFVQLTSRSIIRKTTNQRKKWKRKPVVVENLNIESHPPKDPPPAVALIHAETPSLTATPGFNSTYSLPPKSVKTHSSAPFDSLDSHPDNIENPRELTFETNDPTFKDSTKENFTTPCEKRRFRDLSFSDIGFDYCSPIGAEKSSVLKSIENIVHNTSTPQVHCKPLISKPDVSPVQYRVEKGVAQPSNVPVKEELKTPEPRENPSNDVFNLSPPVTVKDEPVSPTYHQSGTDVTFKAPPTNFKSELFTPIQKSESMKKLAISFAVSPPKICTVKSSLFGASSTPINVKRESASSGKRLNPPQQKMRGATLSPKSLVAFKKSIRLQHVSSQIPPPSNPGVEEQSFSRVAVFNIAYCSGTISDPFARGAIHPLQFLEEQSKELIKWVNSVLTPPTEYSSYEARVDVASLWKKSVASDTVPLPPSREAISSRFHKDEMHMFNLRKTARSIFKDHRISETLYNLYSKISVGYIALKDDIDLHSDQGARCHLVQMLMYYNPLWLRIGLETIYDTDIPLQPRQTVIGLMHFIKNNLLTDKYICEKNAYQNIRHLRAPQFKKEMNEFIIFKFFSLVFFLDVAKGKEIVPYDPCLFVKSSPIKESEGMINEFIKEFVKCVGHMKKNLAGMGFVLSHRQIAIDEYNFAVQSHLDLRDGANLTRLIEIILQKRKITRKLRLPAISRLQKVYNVQLAYNALVEDNVSIVDVLPADIVDGHREKIMSFLWQILHKFLKPKMEKGAIIIQRWWKAMSLSRVINRRVERRRNTEKINAAIKIQSAFRGHMLRRKLPLIRRCLENQKQQRIDAAIKIQRWWKRSTVMKKKEKEDYHTKRQAAITIQQHYRAVVEGKRVRLELRLMKQSAIIIQRWFRSTVLMKREREDFLAKRQAAITIQQHYRAVVEGGKQRQEFLLMKQSAIVIQRWYRSTVLMKKEKENFLAKRQAAITIQQHYRAVVEGGKQRQQFLLMKQSAIVIQRWYRSTVLMKKEKENFLAKRQAAITIQQHYRAVVEGGKQRQEFLLMKQSAIVIQRWYRSTVLMKKEKENFLAKRQAVITIQQHYRAVVEGGKQRQEFLLMKQSAIVIQRWYRSTVLMKKEKEEFLAKRQAAITIQQHYRAVVEGGKQRQEFLLMKQSAIVIQRWYRSTVLMKKEKESFLAKRQAAITIQQHYRAVVEGGKQRQEFLLMKQSAIVIQRWYRSTVLMKKEKEDFLAQRQAAIKIQQHYRAVVEGGKQRQEFLLMKKSAIVIQRWYRSTVLVKKEKEEFLAKRQAAITIQQHYRAVVEGRTQRQEFLLMKQSAIVIQRWYRSTVLMKREKEDFLAKRQAAITFQQHYRAVVEGKRVRLELRLMKQSAIIIQRWYRSTVLMKREKEDFLAKRRAAITIQQHYRAVVEGGKQRQEFLLMKQSAIVIQRWYRSTVLMKKEKEDFLAQRQAAITIQQHYRAVVEGGKQRQEFLLMKQSAIIIQRWYRSTVLMKKEKEDFLAKRQAAITIQQHYRAVVEGGKQQQEFLLMKESAIAIQRWYRSTVLMKKEKEDFLAKRQAAITIQQHYRAVVEGGKQRQEFLLMKQSAIVIQRWYRSTVLMKKEKEDFLAQRQAAIKIQQHYRAVVEGGKQRQEFLLMKKSAIVIQRWYRSTVLMKKEKEDFLAKRQAAITIQQHYRVVDGGGKQRQEFLLMKESANVIQRWYRSTVLMKKEKDFLAKRQAAITIQQYYRAMVEGKKVRQEFLLMKRSAVVIQRWYRAVQLRIQTSSINQANSTEETSHAPAPVLRDDFHAIRNMLRCASRTSLNKIYNAFKKLDFITQHSSVLCEELVKPSNSAIYSFIYHYLDIQSRSDAHQKIFGHGLNILIQLLTYHKTYDAVCENTRKYNGITALINLKIKFLEKNEVIFCRAATVIWLLSRRQENIQWIINSTDIIRNIQFWAKRVMATNKNKSKPHIPVLPSLVCNWGHTARHNIRPKEFPTRIDAITALLSCYNLKF